jgi:hypothetical protein
MGNALTRDDVPPCVARPSPPEGVPRPWNLTGDNNVYTAYLESLQDIHHNSLGSDTVLAWDPPSGTNYSSEIWAPELHRIGANWYIYVAASNGTNETHRLHVLERTAEDPFGPFVYKGQIAAPTDRKGTISYPVITSSRSPSTTR